MDELEKPLGLRPARSPLGRAPYIYAGGAVAAVVVAVAALIAWGLTAKPVAGPVVTAAIEPQPSSAPARLPASQDSGLVTITEVGSGFAEPEATGSLTDAGKLVIHDGSDAGSLRLPSNPRPNLIENSSVGPLPRVGDDGTRPLDAYARPDLSDPNATGRVAIIIGGLGLDADGTRAALAALPGQVTLAFAPYGDTISDDVVAARDRGHELLLQIPMEPFNYPRTDPGPNTLTADASTERNRQRLHWLLSRMTNYVGVMNYMGGRFTSEERAITPVVQEIGARGLLYVDDGSAPRSRTEEAARGTAPYVRADIILDADLSAAAIDAQLRQLTILARQRGAAIATATAFPVTIERVAAYVRQARDRGLSVAPVSALVRPGN